MSTSTESSRSVRASVSRELLVFCSVAVAAGWLLGGGGILLFSGLGLALGVLSLPVVAGVLTWRQAGTLMPLWSQVTRWRVGWRSFAAAAAALQVAIIATALAVLSASTGDGPADARIAGPAIVITFVLFLLVVGGPEEPAWRGYELPRLQTLFDATTTIAGARCRVGVVAPPAVPPSRHWWLMERHPNPPTGSAPRQHEEVHHQ